MFNLSLARIMYGTNEDHRASASMSAAALASSYRQSSGKDSAEREAGAPGVFSFFLHKAWAALHHKD